MDIKKKADSMFIGSDEYKRVYIFGAHSRGRTLGVYLTGLYPGLEIEAYLYDNNEDNPESIDGVRVVRLNDGAALKQDIPVFLAIRGAYQKKAEGVLKKYGAGKLIPVTVELDTELRNKYVRETFRDKKLDFLKIDELADKETDVAVRTDRSICIYVARSIGDSPLRQDAGLNDHEKYIHVGKKLTDQQIPECLIGDDTGDNISDRNKQFCELTAMYWIWKNAREDVVGLEHYRRRFILPEKWPEYFEKNDIDVILPVPLFVAPDLKGNYCARHEGKVWDALEHILDEDSDTCRDSHEFFETNGFYSPCNMLIAKRIVFDSLCSWLFPILFRVADETGNLDDSYQNRYPGFLAERLLSFYFYHNRKQIKAVYSDKSFLENPKKPDGLSCFDDN